MNLYEWERLSDEERATLIASDQQKWSARTTPPIDMRPQTPVDIITAAPENRRQAKLEAEQQPWKGQPIDIETRALLANGGWK